MDLGAQATQELNSDKNNSDEEITRPPFTAPAHNFEAAHFAQTNLSEGKSIQNHCIFHAFSRAQQNLRKTLKRAKGSQAPYLPKGLSIIDFAAISHDVFSTFSGTSHAVCYVSAIYTRANQSNNDRKESQSESRRVTVYRKKQ